MKLKNLFTTLVLAAVLGIGVGAGLAANKGVKEVKADGVPATVYFNWTNSAWNNWSAGIDHLHAHFIDANGNGLGTWQGDDELKDGSATKDAVTYATFDVPTAAVKVLFYVYGTPGWDYNDWEHKTQDLVIPTDGKDTFTMTIRDDSTDWRWNGEWSAYATPKYTITKTAIEFDNDAATGETWALGSDLIEQGQTYGVPANPNYVNMEHFVGWYSDDDCTIEYTATAINADTTIYAKFNKLHLDSYVYWISESQTPVFTHFYAYNEYQTAAWPGNAIADYEVSGVMVFNGLSQKIYKIPVPSNATITMVLNNGSSEKQTYDIDVGAGSAYYTWIEGGQSKYSYSQNDHAAKALDLLLRAEDIRNAVRKVDGAPADYSICGISADDAASLYNEYFALDETAKGMVDNTTTKTYDGADVDKEEVQVSYAAIMAQLKKIALNGNQTVSGANGLNVADMDNVAIIVVITAIASISLVCLLLVVKRRKALNK